MEKTLLGHIVFVSYKCLADTTIGLWKRAMCVVSMMRMVRKFI